DAVYCPAALTLTLDGWSSCNVFCAYHNAFTWNGVRAWFSAVADQNCPLCLEDRTKLNATTVVSTHELIEAVTDPDPAQRAWLATNGLEIADICQVQLSPGRYHSQSQVINGYELAKGWSD